MEYKRLGDYIREVNVRNKDLKVTNPMGINIEKYFMPSVANVIGTDLSAYKMVGDMQFACNQFHLLISFLRIQNQMNYYLII